MAMAQRKRATVRIIPTSRFHPSRLALGDPPSEVFGMDALLSQAAPLRIPS